MFKLLLILMMSLSTTQQMQTWYYLYLSDDRNIHYSTEEPDDPDLFPTYSDKADLVSKFKTDCYLRKAAEIGLVVYYWGEGVFTFGGLNETGIPICVNGVNVKSNVPKSFLEKSNKFPFYKWVPYVEKFEYDNEEAEYWLQHFKGATKIVSCDNPTGYWKKVFIKNKIKPNTVYEMLAINTNFNDTCAIGLTTHKDECKELIANESWGINYCYYIFVITNMDEWDGYVYYYGNDADDNNFTIYSKEKGVSNGKLE